MVKALPKYLSYMPKDSPEDATLWADWLEEFVTMIGAMDIKKDAKAVTGANAAPAWTRWINVEILSFISHLLSFCSVQCNCI